MAVLDIEGSGRRWRLSWQLGTTLIIFGIAALGTILSSNLGPLPLLGWLLVFSGIVEVLHAVRIRRSDGFLFHLIPGVAALPIGLLTATHPAAGAVTWMLVFASVFTVIGLFRAISAFSLKFPNWGWTAFDGIVTVILGSVMWAAWVWLIPWFLGLAAGISLILRGWSSIMFAQGLRRLNRQRSGEDRGPESRRRQTKGFAPS
ncbi:MAG: hypothetical protein JWQ87_4878 [Candidatus Sulfotelmatobacter sp.]|nr:hypothetical protein [Candidatus Sulfotelmatobacter sp.]